MKFLNAIVYISALVVASTAHCSLSDTPPESGTMLPKPREQPKAWFASFFKVGERCPEMLSRRDSPPVQMSGAKIIARVEADKLASREVAADPNFKAIILPDDQYWYWTQQGPMSDHQMHVILKGRSLVESIIIYVKIQERPCM